MVSRVRDLLADPDFRTTDGARPGGILIITPYRRAFGSYCARLKSEISGGRVSVRTVGTAMGIEQDVAIVDIVKSTSFTNQKELLCVMLTRAVQAEIVMLSRDMAHQYESDSRFLVKPTYLHKVWQAAFQQNQVNRRA